MEIYEFTAGPEQADQRLDRAVSEAVGALTRSAAQKLIEEGAVIRNGKTVKKCERLRSGDRISVSVPDPVELQAEPQDIPVEILYEDPDLLVVNKPRGMVVHPAPGHPDGTLVNALLFHCRGRLSSVNGVVRPGIVHRIDKDTSGLLMVAKTDFAHNALAEQIRLHTFRREYRGITVGHLPQRTGRVNAPIGRSAADRKKQAVGGLNAREAITDYEVLEQLRGYDLVRFMLYTGRTHQIRVHCRHLGHPLLGDPVYGTGGSRFCPEGQCLHAALLGFVHPRTGEEMTFESPLPDYFNEALRKIRAISI